LLAIFFSIELQFCLRAFFPSFKCGTCPRNNILYPPTGSSLGCVAGAGTGMVLAVGLVVTDKCGGQLGWLRQVGELWLRPVAAAAHRGFHLGSLDHQDHPSNFCTCLKFFMILYMFVPTSL